MINYVTYWKLFIRSSTKRGIKNLRNFRSETKLFKKRFLFVVEIQIIWSLKFLLALFLFPLSQVCNSFLTFVVK